MVPPGASRDRLPRPNLRWAPAAHGGLGAAEVTRVLEAFARARAARPAAEGDIFDGVRVDAAEGLGPATVALVAAVARAGLEPLVAWPVAGAGDAGYARQGEMVLDARIVDLLAALRDEQGASFAFLADPAAVISRCQTAPQTIWEKARRWLARRDVGILGLATSFREAPAPAYERLWVYGLRQGAPWRFDVDFAPAFRCREWTAPVTLGADALPDVWRAGLDQLESVRYRGDRRLDEPVYSRSFQCLLETAPRIELAAACEAIVYTDGGGWRLLAGRQQTGPARRLNTDKVLELIAAAAERGAAVRLVIDPADLEPPSGGGAAARRVRRLPYPYHHFIGLSSDVDWSTAAQVEAQAEEICDRLGLEMAGSAYPFSPTPSWVAWAGRGGPPKRPATAAEARLPRWAAEGLVDTFHGLASNFDTVRFERLAGPAGEGSADAPPAAAGRLDYRADRPFRAADHDGVLISARGPEDLLERAPELAVRTVAGESVALGEPVARRGGDLAHFHFDLAEAAGRVVDGLSLRAPASLAAAIVDVRTTFASRGALDRLLGYLRAANVRMPVFTSHGGGADSRRLAACVTEAYAERHPEEAALAMDAPGTPYRVLPALARFGLLFFNPIGWFGSREPADVGDLLRVDRNRDGTRSYIFRRFCSRRYEEDGGSPTWAHGKLTSSAQGLAANLEDLLERFHWLEPGHGAILYTHLGHGVGNRINDRLGWTEDLHAAWERLAEFAHGRDRDRPVPFRLWHAPASRILAFSLVGREVERRLRVEGDEVHIDSWRDDVLDLDLPAPAGFGDAWLHGLTIYADEPRATSVFVDGRRLEHLTVNPADETGRPSLSLVDAGNLLPLVHGPGSLEGAPPDGVRLTGPADSPPCLELTGDVEAEIAIHPVSLRNVSHWTFRLAWGEAAAVWGPEASLRVGLRLEDGSIFTAGSAGPPIDDWLLAPGAGGGARAHTFALQARDRSQPDLPRGRVVALVVAQAGLSETRIAEPGLVRPLPVGARADDRRILAGSVRDPAGRPVRRRLRLVSAELELETRSGEDGFFAFFDLPVRRRFELSVDGAIHYRRGRSLYTSADFWDWDLIVADEPGR